MQSLFYCKRQQRDHSWSRHNNAAAFAEAAFVENAIQQRETAIGLQAVQGSARVQANANMRSPADNCRATMRKRRFSGQSELQISIMCSIRLGKCWKSHVPIPEILYRLLENQYLDFRKLSQQVLHRLWGTHRAAYQVLIDALSAAGTRCRWKDPGGTVRTTSPATIESEINGVGSHGTYVFEDTGAVTELTYDEYTFQMQMLRFSTILALGMHRRGDFANFGRIVATKPETVWTELKGLKEGSEEGTHTILNIIVSDIIKSPGRQDSLNRRYLARVWRLKLEESRELKILGMATTRAWRLGTRLAKSCTAQKLTAGRQHGSASLVPRRAKLGDHVSDQVDLSTAWMNWGLS